MNPRKTEMTRKTNETDIQLALDLDGSGKVQVSTGIGFLDHLVTALARHAGFDLTLKCRGDLQVDDHHTAEDSALLLGSALDRVLEDRSGITRFGWAYAPLDEALARCVIDLSGRPFAVIALDLRRPAIGGLACENIGHFLSSFAATARCSLHVDVLRGQNDHHRAEAAFKAAALALKAAVMKNGDGVPSTKGVLG